MKKTHFTIMILLTAAMLFSCQTKQQSLLKGKALSYVIQVPSGWEVCDGLNPAADASMRNPAEKQFMIVLCEKKENFKEDTTLSRFMELSKQAMIAYHDDTVVSEIKSRSSHEGQSEYSCACTVNSLRVRFYVKVLEASDSFLQLVFWTTESEYELAESRFIEIAESLRVE